MSNAIINGIPKINDAADNSDLVELLERNRTNSSIIRSSGSNITINNITYNFTYDSNNNQITLTYNSEEYISVDNRINIGSLEYEWTYSSGVLSLTEYDYEHRVGEIGRLLPSPSLGGSNFDQPREPGAGPHGEDIEYIVDGNPNKYPMFNGEELFRMQVTYPGFKIKNYKINFDLTYMYTQD